MFQLKKQPGVGGGVLVGVGVLVGDGEGRGVGHGPRYAILIASSPVTVPSQAQMLVTWNPSKLSLIASPSQAMYWKNAGAEPSFSSTYSEQTQPIVAVGVGVGVTGTQGP
jgi:hypothetical protein